ncbi:cobaltochelatase subunit CobN [Marinomonas algicola]|uniref:cobaltochelatase subunit CobN n=1 Tax=Marinomonas algicola TaxID=2773454 RepID=UPI00174DD635|nr:cobaltochelatase subunit CobN [Marinomonas algicola]
MHLLAAKPGGFVDDEGIIDLEQTAGDIVFLSASDSVLNACAFAMDEIDKTEPNYALPSIRLANWMQLLKPAAYDLYEDKVLEQAKLVVVSLLGGQHYWSYGFERLLSWSKAKQGRHLIIVPGDDALDESLFEASTVSANVSFDVWRYLREGGPQNIRSLLLFLAQQLVTSSYTQSLEKCSLLGFSPPSSLPACFVYHKSTSSRVQEWQSDLGLQRADGVLLFYRSHVQSGNTQMFDDLMAIFASQGLVVIALAIRSLKDEMSLSVVNEVLNQLSIKVVLNATGFASNRVGSPDLASEPTDFQSSFDRAIPVLQLILSSSTEEDWQDQFQGLRSRDMAMQVVLPEMDGRIVTRAVSFKQHASYHSQGQINLVQYGIHIERAKFVAALAKAYCRLSEKSNSQKRIALILANYPTKDGRIGNGVGLDTPASMITILSSMAQAGYPVETIPITGNALIEELLGAITNNPNTLHERGCWQSLSLKEYQQYFKQLPHASQQAVLTRWGPAEEDHKCRIQNGQARIMLAGIRLGETFVGIQPARGFNVDLAANYHDPDLIPPHSYLAYYFWLRHVYQVDAIVHVGKHGNLEWLPGKGAALSEQCWPDIVLGPMPHFYPFIVNDPGEGAQAKRRIQAAIIDHLMPPMTRAETYGELLVLEGLVDEYYQALGMDVRREKWLKEQILILAESTHLLEEVALENGNDERAVLESLDAYLCEIKEAQIRHGLHVLGQLPSAEKLADTVVALLRLPRGKTPESQGILHSLVSDLGLTEKGKLFDPLTSLATPWEGERPACLMALSDVVWRTGADTKERLEWLAEKLCLTYLINLENLESLTSSFPLTARLLEHAKRRLMPSLEKSAVDELQALLTGLSGGFIPPGPSGAPTRGRLDTLPTGRNFFSVDNRAIPSPAAWALGEKSAQSLIERYLQEHGDYPTEIGLSVWGTATMRTGGDDIAQAFALMGVRPIWASGSNRVSDFEVLSCMQLGRPRVDVTLRVSGFFRDAFPNVMRLFDTAVQAIADFIEPGTGNVIQQHIEERRSTLISQGMDEADAQRQASYRVFGSKPGAYGAGLQGLIDERCWDSKEDLAEAYLNWGSYAYDGQAGDGVLARNSFSDRLSRLELVMQNQDNREHDILDSDDYYQFQGGMTNAVTVLKNEAPDVFHNDHSNPSMPKVRTLKEELNRVIRTRVLNPKWIGAMQEHGYKGAFEMAATVDYLFAYDATTDIVSDYQYKQVCDRLLFDKQNQHFLKDNNPHALEEMAERLLEACQRGMWKENGSYQDSLQTLLLDIDQRREQIKPN